MNVYEHFTLSLSNDCRQEGTKGLPKNTEELRQGAESVFCFRHFKQIAVQLGHKNYLILNQ